MERKEKDPHRMKPRPSYTAAQIEEWVALQRSNKWSINKLSQHLGISFSMVRSYIEKYYAGELK